MCEIRVCCEVCVIKVCEIKVCGEMCWSKLRVCNEVYVIVCDKVCEKALKFLQNVLFLRIFSKYRTIFGLKLFNIHTNKFWSKNVRYTY